jgi:dihydrofolate synthase/folylpolyglutamate synthase
MSHLEALQFLYNLQQHGIQPGLERIRSMMDRLQSPHRSFPSVLIAGTNGKGSTAAMIARGLKEAGYRVGLYTSPHLVDFRERIRIDDAMIPEAELAALTGEIRSLLGAPLTPTFFEFTTALAFLYFARRNAEAVVAEVGLGGRFDATNILTPRVSVITPVDFDHEAYLGSTLSEIAGEKAGIIKPGVPVVAGRQSSEAGGAIERRARSVGAPLLSLGRDFTAEGADPSSFLFHGPASSRPTRLSCPLRGRHQVDNAALAFAVLEALDRAGLKVPTDARVRGIRNVRWEGRLEVVSESPRILLDGAHNPAGAAALAEYLRGLPERRGKTVLVLGMMRDKKIGQILDRLLPQADEAIFTRPDLPRAADPGDLAGMARSYPCRVSIRGPVSEAIDLALSRLAPSDLLCISGSLYLVGEAKAHFSGEAVSPLRG